MGETLSSPHQLAEDSFNKKCLLSVLLQGWTSSSICLFLVFVGCALNTCHFGTDGWKVLSQFSKYWTRLCFKVTADAFLSSQWVQDFERVPAPTSLPLYLPCLILFFFSYAYLGNACEGWAVMLWSDGVTATRASKSILPREPVES